ncbi:MAG TPA: helix-turn-helix domain-containing protein [Dongiaceae bacterium]
MAANATIGDLAKATDTKVETIRYYEQIGLLPKPARTGGNYRSYEPGHFARLAFIRKARELGFSLDQIRELLSLSDQKDRSCADVDAIAVAHLAEVDAKIGALKRLRRELSGLIQQCHAGNVQECRIIEALGARAEAS